MKSEQRIKECTCVCVSEASEAVFKEEEGLVVVVAGVSLAVPPDLRSSPLAVVVVGDEAVEKRFRKSC